ncbi:hypothetical protein BEL04_07665 [Mucilaginibacter sp. PPCGB 2223]|uniref:hypothetical protein n=1 Tax=Mucilaginibacter sp. PPCGB 2223 TaxID=1886027 RepID=UPI0008244BBD|nr:hypothetical protein [Mucilaginibacter sp. PPCGB 2223]OCX54136.1 hypothetical protein BEL04_07665 [Mucilaginibacter sp. PPCGB 2223]
MISSITVLFLLTCYLYFKQFYGKLIDSQIEDAAEKQLWAGKLKKKLIVFFVGAGIIVILYATSFTIMKINPELENVKLIRRIADLVATGICAVLFYLDKAELDKKLVVKPADPFQNL